MKTITRIVTAALLAAALLVPAAASAAMSSVSMSGAESVKAGEVITIAVTYRGESLGYVNGHLTYDVERLEYLSGGSSQGNTGLVQLKQYADNADGKLSFQVKFRAVKAGSVKLSLETLETQNLDGDAAMGTPSSGMTVQVAEGAGESQAAAEEPSETSKAEESQSVQQAMEPQKAEAGETAEQESRGIPYPILAAAAVVIAGLILVIAVRLRKKQ